MSISAEEYLAPIDDIMLALGKREFDERPRREVLAIACSLKGEIMRAGPPAIALGGRACRNG